MLASCPIVCTDWTPAVAVQGDKVVELQLRRGDVGLGLRFGREKQPDGKM
jgi:hypothetical protein